MSKRTVLAAVAASILATTSVFAQVAPNATAPTPPPPHGDFRSPGRIQERIRAAHDRLGITAAQQPQWDALLAVLRENAVAMRADPSVQALRGGTLTGLPELRAIAEIARQRADAMQRIVPATEALYAVLTPEQQKTADQDISRLVQRGRHRRG